ncbi:potassium channel family protein [Kitasatospora camelliae]|uniref:Potassium channel family protein n=1 Tax=Kitasatospora camelliae TaxID=3156397 RepID=A0AAU8JPA0_9ACTN
MLATLRALLTTAGLLTGYYLLPIDRPFTPLTFVGLGLGLVGVILLLVWQTRAIMLSDHPRLRAAEALSSTATLFLLLFSTVYFLMERTDPGSFSEPLSRTDALYFTVTVFSTVGFGDITAKTEVARVLTMGQMVGDLLLIGVAARIVVAAMQRGLERKGRERP